MKARKLAALLGTGYIVHDGGKTINIGSPLCSELITMDKETKRIAYALGWPDKHKKPAPEKDGPFVVWEGLERLLAAGEIDDILAGDDEIESPVSVFWERCGEVFESVTDQIGWPRTTKEGRLMHDNTDFATREEAVREAIHGVWYRLKNSQEREQDILRDLEAVRGRIAKDEDRRAILEEEMPGEFSRFAQAQADRDARFEASLAAIGKAREVEG